MSSCVPAFENSPEQRTPVDLDVQGTIPPWLTGVLYRTGPGTTHIPTTADPTKVYDIQHWFDGLAMHHRFEIFPGGQRVSYRSRKGAEDLEAHLSKEGKWPTISFGQQGDPCQSIFRKFFTVFKLATAGGLAKSSPSGLSVGVTLTSEMPGWATTAAALPKQASGPQYLVAKTDASILQLIDPVSLEPIKLGSYEDLDPRLDGPLSAAHGCRDKETGDFYNYSCKLGGRLPTYKMFRIGNEGKVDILATIKDAPASYIHSFSMTEKYIVLCVWQAHFTKYGLSILYNMNIAQSIDQKWNPNKETLFYVIDRQKGGVVAKFKTPPFFCFHHLNAYDDPETGDVVIDMSVYEDNSIINLLYLEKLRDLNSEKPALMGRVRRFRLQNVISDTSPTIARDAHVDFTLPYSESIELPTVRPELYHKPYRYAYGINKLDSKPRDTIADSLIKIDLVERTHKRWELPGHTPSEPVFVPRPGAEAEDDGVLLSIVVNEHELSSALVVLDAKEMKEVARAQMKHTFPVGFHGVWAGA